jgi:hypothetical protein
MQTINPSRMETRNRMTARITSLNDARSKRTRLALFSRAFTDIGATEEKAEN